MWIGTSSSPSRTRRCGAADERGLALLLALLVTMLMSALLLGFTAAISTDQRYRFIDRDRTRAFYAAHSGLEKLNADLANLFFVKVAPTDAEIAGLSGGAPSIPSVTFASDGSGIAYGVTSLGAATAGQITTGPYQGLLALKKVYDLDASARTASGGEVHLRRKVETVAIPVFQFGFFSEVDLSFSAADDFDFGGRIHTNGNLFLAQGGSSGATLWIRDRATAVKEIIRQRLSNGNSIDASGSTRTVKVARAPGSFRNLARTEGSVTDGVGSSANPSWSSLSLSTYNGYLRTGKTGARALNLPLITTGGANVDLVRRPPAGENTSNATLYGERYFSKTSLRVLLSDTAADLTSLPGVTSVPPVELDGNWITTPPNNGTAYGPVSASRPPIARSPGALSATLNGNVSASTTANITLSGGVPAGFRLPANGAVRVRRTDGSVHNATCTGKTQNTLTGCTPAPFPSIPANGSMLEVDVATVDGTATVSLPLFNAWQPPSTTINLGNNNTFATAPLTPNTFWVHNGNGTTTLVTCTGYSATQLTNCNADIQLQNNATISNAVLTGSGVGTIGGFLKIELQDNGGVWHDVTMEILNWGIAGPNVEGKTCADPTPNAILRLQRLRDNNERTTYGAACQYPITNASNQPLSSEYWPNVLFDAREGIYRETALDDDELRLGGVIHYVAIDVANLSKWFAGMPPYNDGTGKTGSTNNGFSVYFSDRRNNRTSTGAETGEYGYEDFVNPASSTAAPNGTLNTGEDVNGDGELQTYGEVPSYQGTYNAVPAGAVAPFTTSARPWSTTVRPSQARVNRAIFFRRALKLINGSLGNIVMPGLTIASENPVYIQGDWNANQSGFGNPHAATSVIADALTMLSNSWSDANSFNSPYATAGRPRSSHTYYRVAVISGKGPIFPNPNNTGATYGTDGGAHSFLRFLEGDGSGANTIHYRGSLVTFYFNRQAISPFKCCGGIVYDVPVRDYMFDTDFLDPAKLPPLTPVFRDLNALGFAQETRPGR